MINQKTLHIVRHGKSTWDLPEIDDFDRPLTNRGISNNILIASRFAARFGDVDQITTSPATRAITTAISFARQSGISLEKIKLDSRFYFSGVDVILEFIRTTPDNINSLMIIGHNPDLSELANYFVPLIADEMPTSSIVSLRFNIESWEQVSHVKLGEWFFDYPKKS